MNNQPLFLTVVVDVDKYDQVENYLTSTISLFLREPDKITRYLYLCFLCEYRHAIKEFPGSDKNNFRSTHVMMLRSGLALVKPYGFKTSRKARYKHRWTTD